MLYELALKGYSRASAKTRSFEGFRHPYSDSFVQVLGCGASSVVVSCCTRTPRLQARRSLLESIIVDSITA